MTRTETPWGPWDPAPLSEVVDLFASLPTPWWVAGGYAIELAVGRAFRAHADIDVLLFRRDQLAVQRVLPGWEWWAADPPGTLRRWESSEILPESVHDIWCRPVPEEPWRIQFMLAEADGDTWISRRDSRVRRPVEQLGRVSGDGIPYLAPEVQLFYKAKSHRPKDEEDFTVAAPELSGDERDWLANTIERTHGRHPWVERLRSIVRED